jgi:hypothetical protein
MKVQPTKEQNERLAPLLDSYLAMVEQIARMTDADLTGLLAAANAHGDTNCWFRAYETAQIVQTLTSFEQSQRRAAALRTDKQP